MYSGQFENVQSPIGTFGWWICGIGVAFSCARWSVPSIPHPASELASASEPARPRNPRRVYGSATPNHERVLRPPGELDGAARAERLGLRAVGVLGEHVELLAPGRLDDVLDGDAEERGHDDRAAQDVRAVGYGFAVGQQRDLLRPHAG